MPAAACVAVIVAVPAPSIAAVPASLIFTTLLLLLVNVKAPDDEEVGFSIVNSASPKVFASIVSLPKVGVACLTVKVNVCVALT